MLDAEADRLCNAQRYERSEARRDYARRPLRAQAADQGRRGEAEGAEAAAADVRDGDHRALSAAGELGRGGADRDVSGGGFGAPGRGHHRGAVGHAGIARRRCPTSTRRSTATIEAWRNRPIEGEHPYVYLDGIVLKRSWAGEVRNVSLLVAIAVNAEGYREILGICEGAKEDKAGWSAFLKHLKERGLTGVRLIVSDACMGLAESAAEFFPEAALAALHRALVPQRLQPCAVDQGARDGGRCSRRSTPARTSWRRARRLSE